MKKIILITSSVITLNINAQNLKEADVPATVKESFAKQYPNAKNTEWEKEGANFEAEFKLTRVAMDVKKAKSETIETSAVYDVNGKFIQSEVEIKLTELPKAIIDYVKSTLAGKKIKESSKMTDAAGIISYEIEIDKIEYYFDTRGAFLKKETETDEDMDANKD